MKFSSAYSLSLELSKNLSFGKGLRYSDSTDLIFNRVIPIISIVLRETTRTISDSIDTSSPDESETECFPLLQWLTD